MRTSQISRLSKPIGTDPIPVWELAYFQARNRSRAHDLVLREFEKSGLSQADLARRMNKRPSIVCRLLGAPGNWGLDTISDLLFAISGAEVAYVVNYPLDGATRNYSAPDWFHGSDVASASAPTINVLNIDMGSANTPAVSSSIPLGPTSRVSITR